MGGGKEGVKLSRQLELNSPSLLIGWNKDVSKLGAKVIDYLNRKLAGESFAEIEPVEFFPLGGVMVEDNLISRFNQFRLRCIYHWPLIFV